MHLRICNLVNMNQENLKMWRQRPSRRFIIRVHKRLVQERWFALRVEGQVN